MNRAVVLVKILASSRSFLTCVVEDGICVDTIVRLLCVKAIAHFPLVISLRFDSHIVTWAASDEVVNAVAAAVQVVLLILAAVYFTTHCFYM